MPVGRTKGQHAASGLYQSGMREQLLHCGRCSLSNEAEPPRAPGLRLGARSVPKSGPAGSIIGPRPGWTISLAIWSPTTIEDDASFEEPRRSPDGIHYVFVNGILTIEDGKHLGVKAGGVIRP